MSALLETRNLVKYFDTPRGKLHAVDNVNLTMEAGTTLGVVGESGCGKSTLGRVVLRLLEATSGDILFHGQDVRKMSRRELNAFRQKAQIIFQDPYASLNPRMTVSEIIAEPLIVSKIYKHSADLDAAVFRAMDMVGLAARMVNAYPHEMDGGRRQRIGIARALVMEPEFVVWLVDLFHPVVVFIKGVAYRVASVVPSHLQRHCTIKGTRCLLTNVPKMVHSVCILFGT